MKEFIKQIPKKIPKKIMIVIAIVIVIVLLMITLAVVNQVKESNSIFDLTPNYQAASIDNISIDVYGDGNLASGYSQNLTAATTLSLDKVMITEGQMIEEGDVLAYLNEEKMQENFDALELELNQFQQEIYNSYDDSEVLYIKAPIDGRIKNIQVEEDDLVEDAMNEYGYIALVVEDRMKVVVGKEKYDELLNSGESLVLKTDGHTYRSDITLEIIDDEYCVILPTARRYENTCEIYLASSTKSENVKFSGNLEYINPVKIQCNYGEVTLVDDDENNLVDKGEVIFHVEQYSYSLDSDLKTLEALRVEYELCKQLLETKELTAKVSGIYSDLSLKDGATITRDEMLCVVQSNADWIATIAIDELDMGDVEVGQKATVTIDALSEIEYAAVVQSISAKGSASGGITTYDIELKLEDNEAFKIAMTLSCEIAIESVENAIVVPSSAIKTFGRQSYVIVQQERTSVELTAIKKAIKNNDMEVLLNFIDMNEIMSQGRPDMSDDDPTMDGMQGRPNMSDDAPTVDGMQSPPDMSGDDTTMDGMPDSTSVSNSETTMDGLQSSPDISDDVSKSEMANKSETIQMSMTISNPTDLLFGNIVFVETGLSDSINTEIISGLSEGDQILISTTSNIKVNTEDSSSDSAGITMGGMMGGMDGGGPPAGGGGGGGR